MKTAAGANGAMRKAITAGDTAAAAAKAKEMSDAFDQIAAFFKAKGKDDGVKFAEGASAVGKAVAAASTKEDQTAAAAKLGANCSGCHGVYRDGDKFKGL
jgi:cytochrome c556